MRKQIKGGYTMPIQQCGELAQKWYTGRLEHGWERPNVEDAQKLFESIGLSGAFWALSGS
jgi:hypothetical protein